MPRVFLSYRRTARGDVGHLADDLKERLGEGNVFRDVESIRPGSIFKSELERNLGAADVVLVVITPDWFDEMQRRLSLTETDYVRAEIAFALQTPARIIPVLLGGAKIPVAAGLPGEIAPLVDRQVISLHDESWDADVERLVDAIGRPYCWRCLTLRSLVVVTAILLAVRFGFPLIGLDDNYPVIRGTVVTLLAAYAAIEWLVARRRGRIPEITNNAPLPSHPPTALENSD